MAIVAAVGAVAGAISGIQSLISGLGIKGATQHLSYEVAWPRAVMYGQSLYNQMVTAYGHNVDWISRGAQYTPLWDLVRRNFLAAMDKWWGVNGHKIGIPIHNDLINLYTAATTSVANQAVGGQPLHNLADSYWIWIMLGIDAAGEESAIKDTIDATYSIIWYPAILEAGLDPKKLFGGQSLGTQTSGNIQTTNIVSAPVEEPAKLSGLGSFAGVALSLGLIGAILYNSQKG